MDFLSGATLPKDEPIGELPPQEWISCAETQAVLAALGADGAEIRFVGGCVRDSLARRPVGDIDLATPDLPEQVMSLLQRAGLRALPTGLSHGTVTALAGQRTFEITTLRRDIETDGRHARVAFTDDWVADAARRDFTINALSCRADRMIYDPFGGINDLAEGVIRFVGEPSVRLEEDLLRALRFFRFYAQFGRPPVDPVALMACRLKAPALPTLSCERVAAELFKLLAASDPTPALLLMQGAGVLAAILPEIQHFGRMRMLAFLETRGVLRPAVKTDPLRRLAALVERDRDQALALAARLRLSNADTDRLADLAAPPGWPDRHLDPPSQRRLIYRLGTERFYDLSLLAWAAARAHDGYVPAGDSRRWLAMLDLADEWLPPSFPIRGEDVLALGVAPGPEVGRLLQAVEEYWQSADFQPDRTALLDHLASLVTRHILLSR